MLHVVCTNCRLTPQLHESAGGLPSLKLSLHSCSLPGSKNAIGIETSIALVLPAREHECDTSFVLGRPSALSAIVSEAFGDDDALLFTVHTLPSPVSWLGSHTQNVNAAVADSM
ncbi:hypothetical protein Tco_0386301 [Tanacetum coccineum]